MPREGEQHEGRFSMTLRQAKEKVEPVQSGRRPPKPGNAAKPKTVPDTLLDIVNGVHVVSFSFFTVS